jgi:hypothetical protein
VLPERETMSPGLLRKVRDLVAAGATVVGPRPRKSPSLAGFPDCDAEVERLAADVWGDCDGLAVTQHAFGRGRVIWVRGPSGPATKKPAAEALPSSNPAQPSTENSGYPVWSVGAPPLDEPAQYGDFAVVMDALGRMSVAPDFSSDALLRWVHRREGGGEIYFVVNPEPRTLETTAVFRVAGLRPEIWDPIDGTRRPLSGFSSEGGGTSVRLRFEPRQAYFVVFCEPAGPGPSASSTAAEFDFAAPAEMAGIEGPWEVSFEPTRGGPARIVFDALEDWSRRPEDGIRYYSGQAVYRKTFDLPADGTRVPGGGRRLWLDLGVANLWPNRLIGDELEPPDAEYGPGGNLARWPSWLLEGRPRPSSGRFAFATWKHYTKDSPLLPSGLLGPVRLLGSKN